MLGLLVLFSGAAALIYQVLWVRELNLLLGSTAQAAALSIAIFFTGIAIGGYGFGRLAGRSASPLRGFGLLEIGVALTALAHFAVSGIYAWLYPAVHGAVEGSPAMVLGFKALVAATMLLPTSILMGGTLPMVVQEATRRRGLAEAGSRLYAINTAGGAIGAAAAGFGLPLLLGFTGAYLLAVGIDLLVGLIAVMLARPLATPAEPRAQRGSTGIGRPVLAVAFASGFVTLAVEIIWTRLFAQVLQNSVYTYGLVLTMFLLSLALGAAAASRLIGMVRVAPDRVLTLLLVLAAVVVLVSPFVFWWLTDGLRYLGQGRGFAGYLGEVALVAAIGIVLPGSVLGMVFPYLLKLLEGAQLAPGELVGRVVSINTVGGIAGSLAGGFVILPAVGAWRGLWLLAAVYLALAVGLRGSVPVRAVAAATVVGLLALPTPAMIRLRPGESLLELREGPSGNVAVVQRGDARFLRVNNHYTLGGTGSVVPERNQSLIPLLAHPEPRRLFYLGMGTAITAGAGLLADPEQVTVCELSGDVVDLAHRYFEPYANGLFGDSRVVIHAEDGRQCLARSSERYDLIISDLFVPWESGTGSLYTVDHYRLAARRLEPGGRYVQWIPLWQVSRSELATIAASMREVFSRVTVWRGDHNPERSAVALIGEVDPEPLDPAVLAAQWRALTGSPESDEVLASWALAYYAGNLDSGVFDGAPLNTDNRPVIEFRAPLTHRAVIGGEARWVTGPERDALYAELLRALPPEEDPYLVLLAEQQRSQVRAGATYAAWLGANRRGEPDADELLRAYTELSDERSRPQSSPAQTLRAEP